MNWRSLALLLILANFLYWAWQAWVVQPEIVGLEDHGISSASLLELVPQNGVASTQTHEVELSTGLSGASVELSLPTNVPTQEQNKPKATTDKPSSVVESKPSQAAVSPTASAATSENTKNQTATTAEVSASTSGQKVCRSIGVFTSEKEVDEAAVWLRDKGIQGKKKSKEDTVWLGYWVYLPKYSSREAAAKVVTELKAKKIKDIFIESKPPNRNVISLGLYKQRKGAETRLKQIVGEDYPAKIGKKERKQTVFWLEAQVGANQVIPIQNLPSPGGQVRRIEVKACP